MQSPTTETTLAKNTRDRSTSPFRILSPTEGKTWPTENAENDITQNDEFAKSTMTNTKDEEDKKVLCDVPSCPLRTKVSEEKFCKIPNCPAKAPTKAAKEDNEVEKQSYNIRKNFLALTKFFLRKGVCKLSKEEKKVRKRTKTDEAGRTEEYANVSHGNGESRKKFTEILYERTREAKKRTSKTASCAMNDCPVVAKKLLIEYYVNKLEQRRTGEDITVKGTDSHSRSEKEIDTMTFHSTLDQDVQQAKMSATEFKENHGNLDIATENREPVYNGTVEDHNKIDAMLKQETDIKNDSEMISHEQTAVHKTGLPRSKKFYNLDNLP